MTGILSTNDYLTERQLAELWGIKKNTLQKWRSAGVGPKFIKRVGRIVYCKTDLAEYEKSQTFQITTKRQ